MSYLIDTPAKLELVRVALDQENGLRDAAGNPTPRRARIFRNGVDVSGTVFDPNEHGHFVGTRTVAPEIVVDEDGVASLELPNVPEIESCLGKTKRGVVLPRRNQLLTIDQLPPKSRAIRQPAP